MEIQVLDREGKVLNQLYQWNENIFLRIEGWQLQNPPKVIFNYQKKFSTIENSYIANGELIDDYILVAVPNNILLEPGTVKIDVCAVDEVIRELVELRTVHTITLKILKRPQPNTILSEN